MGRVGIHVSGQVSGVRRIFTSDIREPGFAALMGACRTGDQFKLTASTTPPITGWDNAARSPAGRGPPEPSPLVAPGRVNSVRSPAALARFTRCWQRNHSSAGSIGRTAYVVAANPPPQPIPRWWLCSGTLYDVALAVSWFTCPTAIGAGGAGFGRFPPFWPKDRSHRLRARSCETPNEPLRPAILKHAVQGHFLP